MLASPARLGRKTTVTSHEQPGKISPESGSIAKISSSKTSGSSSAIRRCTRSACVSSAASESSCSERSIRCACSACSPASFFQSKLTRMSERLCSLSVRCEISEM